MRWTLKPKPNLETVQFLQQALQVDEPVAALLAQRGIETYEQAKDFFRPSLSHLHDPFLMKDMQKAVERIEKAIANNENILVLNSETCENLPCQRSGAGGRRGAGEEKADTRLPIRTAEEFADGAGAPQDVSSGATWSVPRPPGAANVGPESNSAGR